MVKRNRKIKKKRDKDINLYRNNSGYYDPTAGKALENIEKEIRINKNHN